MDFPFMIPKKYMSKHNYLVYCNDVLASILRYVDSHNLSSKTITFSSPEQAKEFENIDHRLNDWQEWMIHNGYKEELYEVFYRHTLFSVLSDFCNYTYESIHCAAKTKIWVAYALLRKPFRDNLGYIEWLCADRDDIVKRLFNGTPEEIELKKEKAKENIRIITGKYKSLEAFSEIYSLRYDTKSDLSLEKIWNKANHLVTTYGYTRSNNGSLNFIFTNREEMMSYVNYYYCSAPYIMAYVLELICSEFESIAGLNEFTKGYNKLIRNIKFSRAIEKLSLPKCARKYPIHIVCPKCGNIMFMDVDILYLIQTDSLKCTYCKFVLPSFHYMFDWQKRAFSKAEYLQNK